MDRLRKIEVGGQWWAQKADGSWLRWSREAAAWEKRTTGPPGVRQAIQDPDPTNGPAMGPADRWFNKHFPPNSYRRLLFGLVALPIVGLIVTVARRLTRGEHFSFRTFLFTTVVGGALLVLVWVGMVGRKSDSSPPSGGDDALGELPLADAQRPRARFSPKGFVIGAGVLFVDLTLFFLIADPGASPGMAVAISAPGAMLASLLWQLRTSIAGLVILSILFGFPVALFMMLFGVAMGTQPSFLLWWLIGSVLALMFILPHWWGLRRWEQGRTPRAPRRIPRMPQPGRVGTQIWSPAIVPPWILWTGVSILMISTAVFIRFA